MSEDLLRGIAAELNGAPAAAARTERMAELIGDTNSRVAAESAQTLPFDSSVRKEQVIVGRNEIGLALESCLNVARGESERANEGPIHLALRCPSR